MIAGSYFSCSPSLFFMTDALKLINFVSTIWTPIWWSGGRTRLFAHNTTLLSSLYRRIWRHWTSKMLVEYTLSSVCLGLSKFSQFSLMQFMGLCVLILPVYLMTVVRIRVLYYFINIRSEVWPICHALGLGHETMVCALYRSILLCPVF